ncbi:MAG: hypothetical protein C1943_06570 [Halochromatium sp.]|nr:hypothetical protein [Halochromatium sp.]
MMSKIVSPRKDVLYLFTGTRVSYRDSATNLPDTQLYGLNYLPKYGLSVATREIMDLPGGGLLSRLLYFRLRHMLLFIFTSNYRLIFGPSLVYQLPLKILFRSRAKFVLLNINLNSMLAKYRRNTILYRSLRALVLHFDGIVCLSNFQRRDLVTEHRIPESKLTFIPLGVDFAYYQGRESVDREDFILSVGRDKGRDYLTLIESARKLPEYRFIIVCSPRNLKLLGFRFLPPNIIVRLDIDATELLKLYQTAALAVLPTTPDGEGDGMDCSGQTVLLDLMASGVPVIATYRAYLDDYADDNQEIISIPPGDPTIMAEMIKSLMTTPARRDELANRARERVLAEFTTEKMAGNLATYFQHFLN